MKMRSVMRLTMTLLLLCGPAVATDEQNRGAVSEDDSTAAGPAEPVDVAGFVRRDIEGWTVYVSRELLKQQREETRRALQLTREQLQYIQKVVPAEPLEKLRQVRLWFNPQYEGVRARAEYHPSKRWLANNNRNPLMERSVEFTNVGIFEREVKRMPVFVLHELAHAYHHQVLGHEHPGILRAYRQAKDSGSYDNVQRWTGPDQPLRTEQAYGMNNEKEYFAELTEAWFGRNDFFPFTRDELREHDPEGERMLKAVWGDPLE